MWIEPCLGVTGSSGKRVTFLLVGQKEGIKREKEKEGESKQIAVHHNKGGRGCVLERYREAIKLPLKLEGGWMLVAVRVSE